MASKYIKRLRRFENHSLREVALQKLLPNDWSEVMGITDINHESFDLQDGSALYDPSNNLPHQQGCIRGFVIEQGVLWPSAGAIRTSSGALIRESFPYEDHRDFAAKKGYLKKFPMIYDAGAAATIGSVYRNYYHRFADAIPRLYSLLHPFLRQYGKVNLYVDDRFTNDELRVIHHLAPSYVSIKQIGNANRVRAKYAIHLPYLSSDRVNYSKWFNASLGFLPTESLDWLREGVYDVMNIRPPAPFRKLYVTRRKAKVRRLLNEDEVADYLESQGFDVVALEDYPLQEQVRLFSEAQVIVAQHGAGLTNLLFAQAPRVLEIMSDKDRQIFFQLLSASRGFLHKQIHRPGSNKNADVVLPIDQLQEGLDAIEVSS